MASMKEKHRLQIMGENGGEWYQEFMHTFGARRAKWSGYLHDSINGLHWFCEIVWHELKRVTY